MLKIHLTILFWISTRDMVGEIALLKDKLRLIKQIRAFNGKRSKTARSQGSKFQIMFEQEAKFLGRIFEAEEILMQVPMTFINDQLRPDPLKGSDAHLKSFERA